jgi:hypothetical protein
MTRAQKLQWYAEELIKDASADVKAGNSESAVSRYLQAAEILLLLAKVEQNYPAWRYFTDIAAQCQRDAKKLIALAPQGGALSDTDAPPTRGPAPS